MKKILLVVSCMLLLLIQSKAQDDGTVINPEINYAFPKEYEVADIRIEGVEFLDKDVLLSMIKIRKGDRIIIPGDKITEIANKFWAHGLFSDIRIELEKVVDGKAYIVIYMKEMPRLSKVIINGTKKGETKDVEDKLNLKPGTQITDEIINNSIIAIKKHYQEKGFFNVDVNVAQVKDSLLGQQNRDVLTFNINKNEKVKISEIIFEGDSVFNDKRLRRVFKKTKQIDLNIFSGAKFDELNLKDDKDKLVSFYNENGYRDMRVNDSKIEHLSDNRIRITVSIFEGYKYYFRNITWVGNTIYPSEILSDALGIKKGDSYDQSLLDKRLQMDEDAVTSAYMDNGYLFFNIDPVEKIIGKDSIDIEMRIFEGKQATINNVIIKGNTKTNEHIVRREIRTKPGNLFSKSDIIRTVRELSQLGHFDPETIKPNPIPNPEDGTVDIEYILEEKANDQLEVSGGWGGGMFIGTVGVRFSNFSARNIPKLKEWRPIPTGDGQTVSIRAQTNGKFYQSYNMTFIEPWFGGKKPNSFSVSLFYTVSNPIGYSYFSYNDTLQDQKLKIAGVSLGLGRRLKWPDDYFTLSNEMTYQVYTLDNRHWRWIYSEGNQYSLRDGHFNNLSITTTLARNSMDQMIYPRSGSSVSLSLELTPPFSAFKEEKWWVLTDVEREAIISKNPGSSNQAIFDREVADRFKWIEYHKWKLKTAWYTRLVGNLVLVTKSEFGYLGYYNKDVGPSPFEGYNMGGNPLNYYSYGYDQIALRGYEDNSLTPYEQKAANVYNKYVLEFRYPITLKPAASIYVLTFLEGGNCWFNLNEFNPFSIKRSAGIGLHAFLPMIGMIGFEYGYGLDEMINQENNLPYQRGQFHFILGPYFD